jgi:ABC-type multidrug transport system fused ATPase/permease subunit
MGTLLEIFYHWRTHMAVSYDQCYLDFISNYTWNMVGSAQSVRLKKLYYKTLLEQEVQWFDENDPHKIVTKVATSITAIETATGEKISLMLSTIVTSVAAMFLAFFKCWELSLMLLATLPALIFGGLFFMKALVLYSQREKISYENAASRTEQALGQIKTVKGLNG